MKTCKARRCRWFITGFVLMGYAVFSSADLIIYQHSFSGASADSLNGVAVDVRPGTEMWTSADDIIKADGSLSGSAATRALLDFIPESGKIYTFSANVTSAAYANQGYWLGVGFYASDTAMGVAHIGIKRNGDVITSLNGGSLSGSSDQPYWNDGNNMTVNLELVLDTTDPDWVVSYLINDDLAREYTFSDGNPAITSVGIGKSSWASGTFNEMSLSVIPEPATVGIFGFGTLVIMFVRKRARI